LPALTGKTPTPEKQSIAVLSKSEMAKIQTAPRAAAALDTPQMTPPKSAGDRLQPSDIQAFQRLVPRLLPTIGTSGKAPKNPPAVFILAPPRSGTTLLRVMLAGHPKLFAVNELQLLGFNDMRERAQAYTGKFSLWKEGLIRAIMEIEGLTADAARAQIEQYEIAGMTTKAVFAHLQNKVHPRILVDKSPSYVLDPAALEKAETDFENPVYIHLVRHPYSMVRSFVKYHMDQVLYLHPHNYSARQLGELVWLESHKNTALFLEKVPRHRHIRVLYEDLVTQPAKVMWEICRKIGVPFHDNVLRPYADLDKKMTDGIYRDSRSMGDIHFDEQKDINPEKAREWMGVLKDNFLTDETWSLAGSFGYELPNAHAEPATESLIQSKPNPETTDQNPTGEDAQKAPKTNSFSPQKTNDSPAVPEENAPATEPLIQSKPNPETTDQNPTGEDAQKAQKTHPFSPKKPKKKKVKTADIAVIGMAVRVAGADSPEQFWANLKSGKEVGKTLNINDLENKNIVNRAYVPDQPEGFDAAFFGLHPKEAEMTDPQHRLFLETAWLALENAGYNPWAYDGKIGVFGGVARNSYFTNNVATRPDRLRSAGEYLDMLASEKSFSVTRVAYKLNMRGPAVNVQTACSSSGVAVHLACQSLLNGDADMALVGGGRIQPPFDAGYDYKEGGPLSPDGYIRAFDERAQGMVQGHGMVMIVLKKLKKAVKDGDHIWSVIKGTAVNNDGSEKIGFTAPSIEGQAETIVRALRRAGVSAADISYVEAHGTGTLLGDPIEIAGLTRAFRQFTDRKQYCAVGSVKTNIGHLDAGACVAGIIKTSLALYHGELPPSLHFERPNPQIDFDNSPFFVNDRLRPWIKCDGPRRAGVSSFGLGGTNVHVILEEAPKVPRRDLPARPAELLLFSGKTATAAQKSVEAFEAFPRAGSLADAAFTLAVGRAHFEHRIARIAGETGAAQTPKHADLAGQS
ncbi:MAG: hypothetical protein D6714_17270, partial [Bacteroidetes bacterium]